MGLDRCCRVGDAGERLASRRLPEGLDGNAAFHSLVADHAEDPSEVIVGIETERGMRVQAVIAAGYIVFAINCQLPRSAQRSNKGAVNPTSTPEPPRPNKRCARPSSPPRPLSPQRSQ